MTTIAEPTTAETVAAVPAVEATDRAGAPIAIRDTVSIDAGDDWGFTRVDRVIADIRVINVNTVVIELVARADGGHPNFVIPDEVILVRRAPISAA